MPAGLYKWIVLITVSIANFSAALDISIVTVSFPRLVEVFHSTAAVVIWLVVGFSMAELGLVLTLARIADTIGRKKVFVSGLVLYTVGLICCSFSPNIGVLIASRMIQGAGAAMALTVGGAIVVAVFPPDEQGRAIGIFGMLMAVGLIAGPALGGVILDFMDWQGIFYTRIPVGVISLVLAAAVIREQKGNNMPLRLDVGGALTLLAGTACLLVFLNLGHDWGYLSRRSLFLGLCAVVLLGFFIYFERRAEQPVLDLSFFKSRVFSMASSANFLQMLANVSAPTLVPFFLISGLSLPPFQVGLLMALIAIPPVLISPVSGWVSDRIGTRRPMVIGTICFSIALFTASRLDMNAGLAQIIFVFLLFGCGIGIFNAPAQSAIVGAVHRQFLASALGVANATRLLAASIGAAFVGSIYSGQYLVRHTRLSAQGLDPAVADRLAVVQSFQFILLISAVISVLAILAAIGTGPSRTAGGSGWA